MSARPKQKQADDFVPGRGYTREDWDDVDSPEATDEQLAQARPFAEVFPELAESIRRARGRPATGAAKQTVSIRLDPDVIAKFKATGPGWHRRINDILRDAKV
jgi:uncharacterized protein (DUF4415 family)